MTQPSLLLLIPAYNEEQRIEPVLREYAQYFREHYQGKFQLVVVLNGCKDNTLGVVQRVAAEFPTVSALDFPEPIGKGGALIEGLKLAPLADLIGYVDADGATAPKAFHDLVRQLDGVDCVIGSRWLPGAILHQSQTWLRRFTSRVFHAIVQALLWMNIKDTQCPAKVMRRAAVEKIHSSLRIADLAFDVNLLYCLKREKLCRPRSADRMDGQNWLQGDATPVAKFVGDVSVRGAIAVDLFAVLSLAGSVASAGRLDLQKAQGPAATSGIEKRRRRKIKRLTVAAHSPIPFCVSR